MAETITDTLTRLTTFIQETYPTFDLAPGTVFSEFVLKLNATLQNPITNDIGTLNQANSIQTVLTSATDTYGPLIDEIASNYNTSRNQGTKSVGKVKITVAKSGTYFPPSGFTLNQPVLNLNYVTTAAYRVTPTPTVATDIQLVSANGVYFYILPVVAASVGTAYQVSDQTQFAIGSGFAQANFVSAVAYGNFTSGQNLETDKQLIARFQASITNGSLLTHNSINNSLKLIYPSVTAISVIGANDPEMVRDQANSFGISTLGMADVYVRTSMGPETILVTKTATASGTTVDDSGNTVTNWVATIDPADAPGFYRIVSVLPSNQGLTGTLTNTATYGFNTVGYVPANTVNTLSDGRFTKYQTCSLSFGTNIAGNPSTSPFDILLSYQPNIADIQNYFLDNNQRIACSDYLVKAVVPCYVTLDITLHQPSDGSTIPVASIKQDIFNYINSIPFGESVYASEIVKICHNYNIKYMDLPITMNGDIYTNTGSVINISSTDVLSIPTDLAQGVTSNTTLFFIDFFNSTNANAMSDSIGITIV